MKIIVRCFLVVSVCIVLSSTVAQGAWKEKVTRNQINVVEYVAKLRDGGDPDKMERPHLRWDEHYKAKQARKELVEIMADAETLARAGKHKLIPEPEFKIKGLSDERAMEMFGQQPGKIN